MNQITHKGSNLGKSGWVKRKQDCQTNGHSQAGESHIGKSQFGKHRNQAGQRQLGRRGHSHGRGFTMRTAMEREEFEMAKELEVMRAQHFVSSSATSSHEVAPALLGVASCQAAQRTALMRPHHAMKSRISRK
jgi:hypothetical protein